MGQHEAIKADSVQNNALEQCYEQVLLSGLSVSV